MAEDIIKGKIIFDAGGGLTGGGSVAGGGKKGKGSSVFTGILGKLGAIAGSTAILAKASPQLSATFGMMFKALMLILRPIGDVISMFLRPMAIALIRFLIPILKKWNAFKKTAVGEVVAETAGGALTGAAAGALIGSVIPGVGTAVGAAVGLAIGAILPHVGKIKDAFMTGINFIGESAGKLWAIIKGIFEPIATWFYENVYLPFVGIWVTLKDWMFKNVITPIMDKWAIIVEWFTENIIDPIKEKWAIIAGWFEENIIDPIKEKWAIIATWFEDNIIKPIKTAWETITTWFTENIIDPITTLWQTLVDNISGIFSGLWDTLKGWWSRLREKGRSSTTDEDDEDIPGGQTGAYVTSDGLYRLHAGETVVPAHMRGMTNNFTPNITINANINSSMDLQALADELSGIMMSNLQRRNSYTFT